MEDRKANRSVSVGECFEIRDGILTAYTGREKDVVVSADHAIKAIGERAFAGNARI